MDTLSALSTTTVVPSSQTSATSSTDKSDLEQQKIDFLNLLLAQLENQDPLDPMDTDEYTAQLIEYSELEQLMEINDTSSKQLTQTSSNVTATSLSYIGQDVEIKTNIAPVQNNTAEWAYTIEGTASEAYLTVTDESGNVVWEGTGGRSSSGANSFSLDTTSLGVQNGDVLYLSVNPEDTSGNKLNSEISSFAKVDGVQSDGTTTYLTSGSLSYTLGDVLKISS